ncbi:FepA family TonB-dependent siderophore receptor [Basilea psittacipulmonis]|uniref:Outer membrane receptor protein n=1 Tax=Basilea psittacipulmonis DSM 24701 TaxID=1072685 RepID=A0A077DAT1_9BURK|nr:FepA family TonB-dependent siderophore receptor [Basilea psittacipulmonis]AIL32010.1 outer membrane receptor protein [Basilea psittacipulmonis DSM 24701]
MRLYKTKLSVVTCLALTSVAFAQEQNDVELEKIVVTAERKLKQSLGVSELPAQEIEKSAVVNDVSDLLRKMPGVNLTGNTATGQRGNARQIDIRGMGPENTLILIDGRPVTSRHSVRYSWRGQRDTRGDTNWVPVEDIESVEVLRGPAAARYGSGSMGGVVNITTKKTSKVFKGSLTYYTNIPEDGDEGGTNRVGFSVSGPIISDTLAFRLYGNYNKTQADAYDINSGVVVGGADARAAGREGVRNKDIAGRLNWKINEHQYVDVDVSYSRQGNIYAGDIQNTSLHSLNKELIPALYKAETNRMYRQSYAITHHGDWDWGSVRLTAQYDRTTNSRLKEALTGGPEGSITAPFIYSDSILKTYRTAAEVSVPFEWAVPHVVTVGAEFSHDSLDDPASMSQTFTDRGQTATFKRFEGVNRGKQSQNSFSVFVEDNISVSRPLSLVPGLRFDYNSRSGGALSPSLNAFYNVTPTLTIKGGVARVYKAPNLYQSSEGYLLYTRGNGCPLNIKSTRLQNNACYLMGNANLKPETSWNKELGFEYDPGTWKASLAYFHNDYRNKIAAGNTVLETSTRFYLIQWENIPKAVVSGVEGNITLPLVKNTLNWATNFTYMIDSKDKSTGNPLSIIPKYTINTFLDWQINDKWDAQLNATFYGRQKPRQYVENYMENNNGLSTTAVGAYTLVGVNTGYAFNKNFKIRVGVSNLFNKKIYRSNDGANTYNEPGRAYYARVTMSF